MKWLILSFLSIVYLPAVSLSLNVAKEKGKKYALLHLKDKEPILCESKEQPYGKKLYLCVFEGDLQNVIKPKKTPFVDIDFIAKKDKFYIYIKPRAYSQLIDMQEHLYSDQTVPKQDARLSKHWSILLYAHKPFEDGLKSKSGIGFPIIYQKEQYPSIGALDLNGKPMDYVQSNDIKLYLSIKRYYRNAKYMDVLELVKKIEDRYPDSIFMSDVLVYKFKSQDKMLDESEHSISLPYEKSDIAKEAKAWLKAYPADKNTPEVLMLIVKLHIQAHDKNDANYYLDLLISEYPKNPYSQKAILYYADYLYKKKNKKEAIKLYEDVLYSSKDLDIAAEAAIKLTKTSLEEDKIKQAKEYLKKVLNANQNFLYKDKTSAYVLAKKLANKGLPNIASQIMERLLKSANRRQDDYEMKLKDAGIWNEQAKNVNKAYTYLKRYQKEFADGAYNVLVQKSLDRLFFELGETNTTKLLSYYDTLIKRYKNDIGKKALVSKANLLIKQKRYDDVLAFSQELIKEKNSTKLISAIDQAASLDIEQALKDDKCLKAVSILAKYEHLSNTIGDKVKMYKCLMRTSRFVRAGKFAQSNMKTDNLVEKLPWMVRLEKATYAQGKYLDSIKIADDVISLGSGIGVDSSKEVLYDKFFSLMKLKRYDEALEISTDIQKRMPNDFRNVEVYAMLVSWARSKGNDVLATTYAKKALELEEKSSSYVLSPGLEYDYINSLQNIKRYKDAKNVALSLLKRDLSKKQKARALYVIAEAFVKLGDDKNAKKYFQECSSFHKDTSWGRICKENLNLYKSEKIEE